ncbi:hypothetical protein OF83DRAFT_1108838 [Amylostereum chailletii]|nr:hypothetical protein OF83DRAFT_1108838 [Amylostereum chailletii]
MERSVTFNAKRDVANWYSFDLALPTVNRKALRGFNHHGSGRLLCPSDFDYTKEACVFIGFFVLTLMLRCSVRVGLRDNSPHYPRGPDRLPRLMWRDQHVNPNDFYEGFLEDNGPMLALTEILLGPSAAGEGGEFSTSKGGGSRPRASQFKIKSITPAAIACAIVLSHFSLSSQLVMSSGSTNSGRWPYHKFYRNVLACINSMPDNRRNELLAYWTRMVLGDVCVDDEDDEDDEHDTDDESLSSFTRMLAQAHAACLAAAAVVAATSNMPQTSASDVVAPLSQAPQHSPSPSTDSSSEPSSSRASPA